MERSLPDGACPACANMARRLVTTHVPLSNANRYGYGSPGCLGTKRHLVPPGGSNDREGFYRAALDEALGAEALLVGRPTYEFLVARSGELAEWMNSIPKYVVSSTLKDPDWTIPRHPRATP